ncbi:hypothetical protein FRC14_000107 [Serendipita sp. 396]|nr:hypothetical protein FRC14_000107 [Serendipita sp. 396]KAG8789811.1 hypothetical protein FRC15_000003 [Serendipita sp. 397]KAG8804847.1 hypothetical protein FRC16_000101 [Serendipita sp. 398]KAG8818568.1 hypothetical protein FRC19_010561 [Serendipita sp. 401]KAG8823834.1 hypothetical protein FRC18_010654 [Serendipita sp. 400]KAG8844143.1 hypothetical protein FRB91_002810 [Serendipita sp. 411]KAG8879518.1 hypothetical protein FRC20_000090 [Serendipita sp. 405]KAG9052636.1 hypothetical prot
MGESRTELLQWLNELLQVNYTKIEQCGTGAAYCQIFDSIYGDVPLTRVKFAAKHEYESLQNYKILQTYFTQKKIDKPIPVDRLVKCKMQDNLEFLQWAKKYWDSNYAGHQYDAVNRRKGAPVGSPATIAPVGTSARAGTSPAPRGKTPVGGGRVTQPNVELLTLQTTVQELTEQMAGLEKERDFYFNKLREIEILVQQELESPDHVVSREDDVLKDIQKILYSTEEGFEVPETAQEDETF